VAGLRKASVAWHLTDVMDTFLWLASKLLWAVLRPNTLALVLACVGLWAMWRNRRWGRWPLLLGLGYYVVVLLTPISQWALLPLEDRFPRPVVTPTHVDGIVVLGGAVDQNLTEARGIPALNGAAERMTEPLALARRFPTARIVFTGGQGGPLHGETTEADVANQLWTAIGMPESRVTYETRARNTWENAMLTRDLVQPKPGETWLLITSAGHMPRAMGIFRQVGWPMTAWPVNYTTGHSLRDWYDAPFGTRLNQLEWTIHEWIGLVAYRLLGRTDALFPAPQ
jgi:uncharacterized SAM-binding protein YcdF (DUF218 family)